MSNEDSSAIENYKAQLEEHEMLKREGIGAYADVLLDMMGDKVDPDRRILVKEGLLRMMGPAPVIPFPEGPRVPPRMVEIPPRFFEQAAEDGSITLYDWAFISSNSSHYRRAPDASVEFFSYGQSQFVIEGEAAASFWRWQAAVREAQGFHPGGY